MQRTVLVALEDDLLARMITQMAQVFGADVVLARPQDALTEALSGRHRLIVLDETPAPIEPDGPWCRFLAERGHDVRLLVISDRLARPCDDVPCKRAMTWLTKPIRASTLLRKVEDALREEQS
jgi:DNA-binding response OmpR family regulator